MTPAAPLYLYSRARSAGFTIEFYLLSSLALAFPGRRGRPARGDLKRLLAVRRDLLEFLKDDASRIARGEYPASVLIPESPLRHLGRIPALIADSFSIHRRRLSGRTRDFDPRARELLAGLPPYYRRNFHYQTSGYLSRRSAEVYEHQVELLFKGAADGMRRLVLRALRERFGNTNGEGLRFLEVGAGTGRATRFVRLAFPKAKLVALDLSDPYLKVAQARLAPLPGIDFVQADGADLPFRDGEFDAAYSVFLFHELPMQARKDVLRESARALKPGGLLALVDSLQIGDKRLFDPILREFPRDFHEPFYLDYVKHPMEELLGELGFLETRSSLGFSSKLCRAVSRRSA